MKPTRATTEQLPVLDPLTNAKASFERQRNRTKIQSPKSKIENRTRGQALVEMALIGLFPLLLLAAAVDFGRAYYTAVIVTNMAGEGAAYAALYPDQDYSD